MAEEGEQNINEVGENGEPVVEEQPEPKITLKLEQVKEGLTIVSKTQNGDQYAYSNLTVEEKELEELGDVLLSYQHINHLSLSKNQIKDISIVAGLKDLLTLNVSTNQIDNIDFLKQQENSLKHLQILNISQNKLKDLPPICQSNLFRLIAHENEIKSCARFETHSGLRILELRGNQLKNCEGISNLPNLEELYLAKNQIKDLSCLSELDNLKKLHIRENDLIKINCGYLPSLVYLNARENKIADMRYLRQIGRTGNIRKIQTLILTSNPVSDEKGDDLKKELLIMMGDKYMFLKKLNKEEVTMDDRNEAQIEKYSRINQALEEKRIADEEKRLADEEKRLAAEEEARQEEARLQAEKEKVGEGEGEKAE